MWFMPHAGDRHGPYELVEQLGHSGGFGVVWLATSVQRPRLRVALKFLSPAAGNTGSAAASFQRELEACERVRSRNVARPRGADLESSPPWIAYEYIEGRTLREMQHETLSAWDVCTIFSGVAEGLVAIHRSGVIHRDISADNIIVRSESYHGLNGVIIDLGIAILGEGSELTRADFGKPGNYAPEQLAGVSVTTAVDIWQFGAAAAKALTGRRPFPPKWTPWEMRQVLESGPDLEGVPEPFASLLASCLAADPTARPTATDVVRRLGSIQKQIAPRETVRLVKVEAHVQRDGHVYRSGTAVRLSGPHAGSTRVFPFAPTDGAVPAVMIGDVLSVPALVPGAPHYALDQPDDPSLRDGSETAIAPLESCPSCGAMLLSDDKGLWPPRCPDPRWCPEPLRGRIRRVSMMLSLGLEDSDIDALLASAAISDESELFSLTAHTLRGVPRYSTQRPSGRADVNEAGKELLARLQARTSLQQKRALEAVGLSSFSILSTFVSVESFLAEMRANPSEVPLWSRVGAAVPEQPREPRLSEIWPFVVLDRWSADGVRFVTEESLTGR